MKKPETAEGEKAILVGLETWASDIFTAEESLDELAELAQTAGAEVLHKVIQPKQKADPKYHIGKGKLDDLCELIRLSECNLLIFDDELTTRKIRNLEATTDLKVIDRTELILDIFAQRARTKEGKLQVELAQLKYFMPRLTGKGVLLSRLGGGIGTRGPGETKLEKDRRRLTEKIRRIEKELEEVRRRRDLHRKRRKKEDIHSLVVIIGYTNAGKSTLFASMTNETTLIEDKLFATLDPLTRICELGNNTSILILDTVGFIKKLPHHLIESFRSTLEELACADLLLNVVDISHPHAKEHMTIVDRLLDDLEATSVPVLTVLNKADKLDEQDLEVLKNNLGDSAVVISSLTGHGLEDLKEKIRKTLFSKKTFTLKIPHYRGDMVARLYDITTITQKKVDKDNTTLTVEVSGKLPRELEQFLI